MRGNRTLKMLMILLFIVMIPLTVRASESNYKIVKSEVNYIIYIENYEDVKFLFAFSNDSTIDVNDLDFTENWTDTNESNIACLDDGFGIDFSQPVYMWVKDSAENYILSKVNLDLDNAINLNEISELNELTERIKVDTTQKDIEKTNQDGVETRGRYHWATIFNGFLRHPHALSQNLSDCLQDYLFKDGCRVTLENGNSVSSYS